MKANLAPKYPRCFIWYDLGNKGDIGEVFPSHCSINYNSMFTPNYDRVTGNIIMFESNYVDSSIGSIDINLFLDKHKGKYKEISLKEFMGECLEGDFGIIKIPMRCDPNGQVIYTLVEDEFSKKRIKYLKNNIENKYNAIRLYEVEGDINNHYYYANTKSYTIDKENNCIIFEIDPIPPFNMVTQVKVSFDAEVINNENNS